jgi:hypothetical protein
MYLWRMMHTYPTWLPADVDVQTSMHVGGVHICTARRALCSYYGLRTVNLLCTST